MKARFSIEVDVPQSLVRMTLGGFFHIEDIERLVEARNAAFLQLQCGPHEHLTMVDVRDMDIQPQDSVAAFQQVLADPTRRSKRLAFVVARSLARIQAKRATDTREVSYFVSPEEAEHWLLNG
ncbi:hypothetical protein J2W40_002247 [Sphingobium xenophagum]|uniref:STAS/SEC14 domain-containing protein n=1 Tax=Sphingobium xenophagum TaxID=121428 RepID=A0ABU1X1H1_SPHXE|nr:hypothetical protein [Sphingobium xenophagum]MDR7155420.1 hypothetical protein [Sphingobium xenophagum]